MANNKSSTLTTQQTIAICIAIVFIGITCTVAVVKNVPELNLIIFIMIGFSLGLLSFLIVGRITGSGDLFGLNIKSIGGGFAVFVLVILTYFALQNDVFGPSSKDKEVLNIEHPADLAVWEKAAGEFKWFNAPFAYASDSHLATKYEWLKKPNFRLNLLMFDSTDPQTHATYFLPRFEDMKQFIRGLDSLNKANGDNLNLKNQIFIKYYLSPNIPTISFFTTLNDDDGNPYSIIYMTDKSNNRKVTNCLTTDSEIINVTLDGDFESYWGNDLVCKQISIADLLNKELTTDSLIRKLNIH